MSGVNVAAFKVSDVRPLVAHLDSMDNFSGFGHGNDEAATTQFDTMEAAMQAMIVNTHALLRKTSAFDGTFAFSIAPIDSVLVVGFADMEDEPYVYDYKIMSGMANTAFILDMSRGQCGF